MYVYVYICYVYVYVYICYIPVSRLVECALYGRYAVIKVLTLM